MSFRRRLRHLLTLSVNLALYPASGLVPRSHRQWVFGHSGDRFMGNPKYLFLWMSIHRPDIRLTWLTDRDATRRMLTAAGYRALRRWSPGGIAAVLRAKVFVFSHGVANVNAPLSRGAYLLNLWHGVGLKAVHFGHEGGNAARADREATSRLARLRLLAYLAPPDALATTSDFMQVHFAEQFRLPPERCPQLGYPRLDCAADPALMEAARAIDRGAGFDLMSGGFAELYIYMPTFRDTKRPFLAEALPDPGRLSAILATRNAVLYVKPHPRSRAGFSSQHDNIRLWPDAIDPSTYLSEFTGLITDYSSILYDCLFVRSSGAILYTFDYDEYVGTDRALLYPLEENVAGLQVASFDALCAALEQGAALAPVPSQELASLRARFWGGNAVPASPVVIDYVQRACETPSRWPKEVN